MTELELNKKYPTGSACNALQTTLTNYIDAVLSGCVSAEKLAADLSDQEVNLFAVVIPVIDNIKAALAKQGAKK